MPVPPKPELKTRRLELEPEVKKLEHEPVKK
jgi:hypothetical protein